MKKSIPLLLSAFILAMVVFISCKKNEAGITHDQNIEPNLSIQQAKNFYLKLLDPTPVPSELSSVFNIRNYNPLWNQAITGEDENYYIVEAPMKFGKDLGINIHTDGSKSTPDNINGKTKLLVLRNKKTQYLGFILMHVVPDNGSSADVNYKPKNSNFSGYILFTDLYGGYVNSWRYNNGVPTKEGHKNLEPEATSLADNGCYTVGTDFYERTCTETGYNTGQYTCGPWTYLYTNGITYCDNTGGSGGGGTGAPPDWGFPQGTKGRLCQSVYNLASIGNTWVGTINNLHWNFQSPQGTVYTVNFPQSCLVFTSNFDALAVKDHFNTAVNNAVSHVIAGLNNGSIQYANVTQAMSDAIQAALNQPNFPNTSWSGSHSCGDNIPVTDITDASYCESGRHPIDTEE